MNINLLSDTKAFMLISRDMAAENISLAVWVLRSDEVKRAESAAKMKIPENGYESGLAAAAPDEYEITRPSLSAVTHKSAWRMPLSALGSERTAVMSALLWICASSADAMPRFVIRFS